MNAKKPNEKSSVSKPKLKPLQKPSHRDKRTRHLHDIQKKIDESVFLGPKKIFFISLEEIVSQGRLNFGGIEDIDGKSLKNQTPQLPSTDPVRADDIEAKKKLPSIC